LAPEAFPDRYKFGFRYTNARRNWFTGYWEFKGGKNLTELRDALQRTCMVRRTKQAVLLELPPKIYSTIPIKISGSENFQLNLRDIERIDDGQAAVMSSEIATARRGLGLLKVDAAVEHILNIMESKNRCVVFAYHRDVINALYEKLVSENFFVSVIHGDTPMDKRDRMIQLFQNNKEVASVLIGQITAAGVGITLTAADICVFVELDWTPANMAQAIDRLHRIGQKEAVEVHYLVAADTMDDQIITSLRTKIEAINKVLQHQKGENDGQEKEV
jgi:SWI/SNF-related matrix-associated actin-dependent regulator 1 of chromatin subfamily A